MAKTKGVKSCTPPNKKCGSRCIPPDWDCRLRGEGSDRHLRAVGRGRDPLAAASNIQRGVKSVHKGVTRGSASDIERGRRSIIRGVVKGSKGDIQEKKELQAKLINGTIAASAAVGVLGLGVGLHRVLSVSPSYKRVLGGKINETFAKTEDTILDNVPLGIGRVRQQRQSAAQGVAANLGRRNTFEIGGGLGETDTPGYAVASSLAKEVRSVKPESYGNNFHQFRADSIKAYFGARTKDGSNIHAQLSAQEMISKQYKLNLDLGKELNLRQRSIDVRHALTDSLALEKKDLFENAKARGIKINDDDGRVAYAESLIRGTGLNSAQETAAISTVSKLLKVQPSTVSDDIYQDFVKKYDQFYDGIGDALAQQYTPGGNVRRAFTDSLPVESSDIIEIARIKHAEYLDKILNPRLNDPASWQGNKRVFGPFTADLTTRMYFETNGGINVRSDFTAPELVVNGAWREVRDNDPDRLYNFYPNATSRERYEQLSKMYRGLVAPPEVNYFTSTGKIKPKMTVMAELRQQRNPDGTLKYKTEAEAEKAYYSANSLIEGTRPMRRARTNLARIRRENVDNYIKTEIPRARERQIDDLMTLSSPQGGPLYRTRAEAGKYLDELGEKIEKQAAATQRINDIIYGKIKNPGNREMAKLLVDAGEASSTREALRMLTEPGWVGKLRRRFLRGRSDSNFDSRVYRYDKGKRCGNSYIPSSFNCTRGKAPVKKSITRSMSGASKSVTTSKSKTKEESENSNNLGRKIAIGAAIAGVGVLALSAANDAYQLSRNLGLPKTQPLRQGIKPFIGNDKGPGKVDRALGRYYDSKLTKEKWEVGDLLYATRGEGPASHFAVYGGKKDNAHNFIQVFADGITERSTGITTVKVGPNVPKKDRSAHLFERVPSSNQPKSKYSATTIANRVSRLASLGDRGLSYDTFDENCESWARMIVSGENRSMQAEKLSLVGKFVIRRVVGVENTRSGMPIKEAARWLNTNNPRGNDQGYNAMIRNNRRDRIDEREDFLGLVHPRDLIKSRMSDLEAISATKRWLMVLTTALAMANGTH